MTVAINKDGHARIIIMRPETILHSRPNTFSQTASRSIEFLLHSGGGPYIFQQLRKKARYYLTDGQTARIRTQTLKNVE